MYNVASQFHTLATNDPKTRCRIYFIGDSVDCTDDNDVQTNGTLLVRDAGDTDSNKIISGDNGVSFSDLFNTDNNLEIGKTVSKTVQIALLNLDGGLNNFTFGRCKIYIDVYDSTNSTWLACPIGVFLIEQPTKLNTKIVNASGYDQMQYLDRIADAWWNEIDWTNGVSVSDLITSIATECGVSVSSNLAGNILNPNVAYTSAPFTANKTTYRDILARLAGITGTIAYFDRDGALDMRWFKYATLNGSIVTADYDAMGNGIMSLDLAEYAVSAIDMLEILPLDPDLNVSVGDGDNVYELAGNPFFTDQIEQVSNAIVGTAIVGQAVIYYSDIMEWLATPIYDRLKTVVVYRPITMRLIADWSIEAGDVIKVTVDGNDIVLPIMQQTITWRGGFVLSDMMSSGDPERKPMDWQERTTYQDAVQMHEFANTANELLSRIQDLSGNYSLIQQTVNQIEQTVSAQGTTIQSILDPTGQIWTAISTNSTNLSSLESALNDEISDRKSYIRFLPLEPAIVLGVDNGNEIKLKLVNNVIYFFNGADDSTDLSLAYAYFNNEEAGMDRLIAKESVQIGTVDTTSRWLFKQLINGDLVLDLV